jgi:hypothetical protein
MATTLKQVNKRLMELSINLELVRGNGYFYVVGKDSELMYNTSIMVRKISSLTVDQWIFDIKSLMTGD